MVKRDLDRIARRFATDALARSGDEAIGAELAALEDEAPEVQRALFLALARLGVPVAMGRIREIYREFPPLRQAVVESLGTRREPGVDELLESAISDPSPGTRMAAAEALGGRDTPGGLQALRAALGDADPAVRLQVVDALLARPDGAQAVPALIGALIDQQGWEEVRRIHAALRRLTGAEVPDPIQSEESTWGRATAGWRAYLEQSRPR